MKATAKKFPNNEIILISDRIKANRIKRNIRWFKLENAKQLSVLNEELLHPKDFRNNFWMSSIGRFVALTEFARNEAGPFIHIESDVVISKDFPIEAFEELDVQFAYPIVAANRGVASVLFVRDFQATEKLSQFALEKVKEDGHTTDMVILSDLNKAYPTSVLPLPFGPAWESNNYRTSNPELKNLWHKSKNTFGGIFDGNDIGTFLYGTDPRNKRGVSTLRSAIQNNYADIVRWKFAWDEKVKFPCISDGIDSLPIYSLHITNKRLKYFSRLTQNKSLYSPIKLTAKPVEEKLFISVQIGAIIKSLKRRIGSNKLLKK